MSLARLRKLTYPPGRRECGGMEKSMRGRGRPRVRETVLSRWLDRTRADRDQIAGNLEISRSYLDRLANGSRRPSLALALRIEKLTVGEVAVGSWEGAPTHGGG